MHPIRDAFSRRRWLLLCSACALAFAGGAEARPLVPEKPSVEVNLNALRALTPATYLPAPPARSPYDAAPMQRQVPAQQYGTPAPARKPVVKKPAPKPAPPVAKPAEAPEPTLPPPPAPKVEVPAPAPVVPVAPLPVAPAPSLPSIPAAPAPAVALPVVTPPKIETPKPAPVAAPKPAPAPKVEMPKPAVKVEAPKPAVKVEAPKPALPSVPALPPLNDLPPASPPDAMPPLPKVEAPTLPSIPKADSTKPATPMSLPPMPMGTVNVPSVAKIRTDVPPEPDISGLNFSKLPTAPKPTSAAAPIVNKKVADSLPPLAPVAPNEPSLPPPPKANNGPLLIPVPKPPTPLPPSVAQRLDVLNAQPTKQGVVSDTTVVKDIAAEQAAKKKLAEEAAAKLKADQAAAAAALKQQQVDAEAARKKAQVDIDAKAKADADAKLKAETEMAAAKKAAEDKAKADADAAKKAALKLPPASLPPPLPSIPAMPDPLAKSAAPVKLDNTKIGALPAISNTPAPAATVTVPALPKAPTTAPSNPNLPKLPTLTIPGTQPDKPLPSLTAITGGENPSTADILQPRDAVDSTPLLPATGSPIPPALETMDDNVPMAKRELPEINIGATAPKSSGLPIVTAGTKPLPPTLPSIPAPPTVTPKTDTEMVVASAPAVSTSGNLETSITFGANSSALTDDEKNTLSGIAEKARKAQKKVRIVGYASGDADKAAVARKTAFARANIIRAFLLSKGMADSMIHAQALGNQVPQDKADIFLQ